MGLAADLRILTDYDEALALLDEARSVATEHSLTSRLTQLHHLRGNLCFSLGRTEECRKEHLLALDFARQCQSAEGEARAYGGLGDAEYARGRHKTSMEHYTRCIDISREHGFGRTEVAHLAQRGWARVYTGDWQGAKEEIFAALEVVAKVADYRAEVNARLVLCETGFDLGDYVLLESNIERVLELTRAIGARAWSVIGLIWKGMLLKHQGRQSEAYEALLQAAEITRDVGLAFNGGRVFGGLAWVMADDDAVREAALEEGKASSRRVH